MKNVTYFSQSHNNNVNIYSEDIKNMIETFGNVREVRDISELMEDDVLAYNVSLNSDFVEEVLQEQVEDISYAFDNEEMEAELFEQADYVIDAMVDNLKDYIESRYNIDEFESAYDIYRADTDNGIGFSLTLSFGKVKHGRLYELASKIKEKNSFL